MASRRLEAAIAWLAAAVVAAGAAQQAATALEWLSIGRVPGAWEPGHFLLIVALLVLVILGPALLAAAALDHRVRAAPAIAVAAAALTVARFESFDAYYAPTLRRMSDGVVSATWVAAVVACAVAAAGCAVRCNRLGTALAACVCWIAFATAFVASLGH
jgi:hypothetical protein